MTSSLGAKLQHLFNIVSFSLLMVAAVAGSPWLVPPRNVTYHSLVSNPVLAVLAMPGDAKQRTWTINDMCGCGQGIFDKANVTRASQVYGLFDEPCDWPLPPVIGEWGYELMKFTPSAQPSADCIKYEMASYTEAPSSRMAAFERMKKYWNCRFALTNSTGVVNLIGHYYFNQLGAELNNSLAFFSEVGENTGSVNAHFAFSRGAARTYAKPWAVDMSAWMQGFITDFSMTGFWGPSSRAGGDGGHSMSLFRRVYFTTYMAGASALSAEAGSINWFLEKYNATSGALALSPLGYIGQEMAAFARTNTERGIAYTPIGIVLQNGHGLGIGWMYTGKAWDVFPLTDGEQQATDLLEAIWPRSWQVMNEFGTNRSEMGYNVASPYGDIFDGLVAANLTSHLLSSYRILWLAGDVAVDDNFAALLQDFVSDGGVLIVTASQVQNANCSGLASLVGASLSLSHPFSSSGFYDSQLATWTNVSMPVSGSVVAAELHAATPLLLSESSTGEVAPIVLLNKVSAKGAVVTLLIDATPLRSLAVNEHLLSRMRDDISPFSLRVIRGGLPQVMFNRGPSGWNVTLVNNYGVVKQPGKPAMVDEDQLIVVEISMRCGVGKILRADALVSGAAVPVLKNGTLHVGIGAGEVEVVGISTQDLAIASGSFWI